MSAYELRVRLIHAPPRRSRSGFTLVNVMTTVALIAIVAAVTLPAISANDPVRVVGAAYMMASDIEYAQSLSLSSPDDPALVRIDLDKGMYWIARDSDTETPIERSNGDPYIITYGAGLASMIQGVWIDSATSTAIRFDQFGRLQSLADAVVVLSNGERSMTLRVSSSTGFVAFE